MKHFKFCPQCGQETLLWDDEKKWSCSSCDFLLFHNCAGAVAVIIRNGDEIMLTRRNQEPGRGLLDLAGGFVDPNESAEETCERELYEELRLKINPGKLEMLMTLPNVYHYKGINYNTLDIFFEYSVEDKFEVTLEHSEVSDVVWLKVSEINLNEIAFDSQKKFFAKYQPQ